MKILAIDLGDTSGYVLIDQRHEHQGDRNDLQTTHFNVLLRHGAISLLDVLELNEDFADLVVVERPAYTTSRRQQQYSHILFELISRFKEHAMVVRPTDWKQRFGQHPLPGRGVLKTQHEKDAWRIAAWAADKFGGNNGSARVR